MNGNSHSRRSFLATGSSGLVTGLAASSGLLAAAPSARAAGTATACGGMSRERYMEYVGKFNANDPSFIEFYHDNVILELKDQEIHGARAIRDFYAVVKAHIHETVQVTHYIADATGIAVELPSEFKVFKDWDSPYFKRYLKAGEVLRVVSFGLYWVKDGRFTHIKAARYKMVNDWKMEA
jgi:hypothetical protein